MANEQKNTIDLEVLTVASNSVLGKTEPLKIAAPCTFSNADGTLCEIEGYDHIRNVAAASARNFLAAFAPQTA